ncbi:hypothetical protein F2P56_005045 [Juglans regia]|uniref:Protein arginine N-methyltransferase domain-containing protein n=1 Tax=Juglans regia TaxID=51240 RepID=A0A834D6S3_JUGRE|nr:hypothetical protein F2P56_005045 [Juglans regia]
MASLIPKTLIPIRSLRPLTRFKATATRAMSSGSTQRVFQLKLDPLTGNSEWVVIEDQDQEEQVSEIPHKPLLGTTSYLDMLNDSPRNRAFRQAIDKTVTKPCHVLDIGAGTGLLSMMAARAMGSSDSTGNEGMVTACESYLPMVKLMRKVARLNGMERKIKVINKRSDELKVGVDIPSRADILVSEILDSELLGEGLIPTLQHAHDELLVENPQTVPYRAITYGQLVESTFLWKLHDLQNNEAEACDGIHLVPSGLGSILGVKPQQYAMHCDAIKDEIKLLSEPFKIFEFDFWKRPDSHRECELHIKATNDGRVNAVVSWWTLQLDCEGNFFYSTAPGWISSSIDAGSRHWCDHWKQCVWFVPGKGISVFRDEEVYLHAVHSDTSISYNLKTQASRTEGTQYGFDPWDLQLILSPERIAIYGDNEWRHSMLKTLRNARYSLQLQERVNSLCIVADDSVFLTLLIAHLSRTSHVISMFPGLRNKGAQYLQAVANANGFSIDHVTVLEKRKTYLTLDDTHQRKVDLLIGEPFYYGLDGMLPWQNLRFWKERTVLDRVLSEDVLIMPCKGILKACAMSLPDLWNSRRCLSKIEGFDHSLVNTTLGACGELPAPDEGPCLPFYVWQCGESKVDFTESGICHGFALWIDWVMDSENSTVVSTGPDKRYWKQGVKLLAHPVAVGINESRNVGEHTSMVFEASFDPSNGELIIRHDFL